MRLKFIGVILLCLSLSACTAFRKNLEKNKVQISSHVQENNSAARIANEVTKTELEKTKILVNTANKITGGVALTDTNFFQVGMSLDLGSRAAELTGGFLERNENLIGKPAEDQNKIIEELLSENKLLKLKAEQLQSYKISKEESLINDNRELTAKLVDYGTKYEQERNARISFWTKWLSILGIGIGGIVALCVFVPVVIPFIIGIFPKLISIFGVVGKSVVTNLVKGVGEARNVLKVQIDSNKNKGIPLPTYTAEEALSLIDKHLYEQTADKDQKVIDALRERTNV